ncbi:MAG TPA: flagellar biosynthesis protein FlhA [Clostridiales bacterium]|nr:flagellar biosynthesis protein FlhA [Clostridiales bacterium]
MFKFGDIVVAIAVIAIVLLIIIPIPTFLMDMLLTFNISLSLVILIGTMYIKEALEFSIFPTLLLITTLFRLALNISSTRLILSNADAGNVIEVFGNFVIGNNVIVGVLIYLIIVIIQFLVITKGAERVAEVAARFTLDAMPGKQMAIDADLNSGLISENEAKERRKKIQREADFYGAMDGASKFVKGDAIAGIIITIINITAGFIIGVLQKGMGIAEAASVYTNLTIGDGLVSQIPALLISTATGIIVTRAANESDLGSDVSKQIFSQPRALYLASGALFLLAFTGLPVLPNVFLSGLFSFMAYNLDKAFKEAKIKEEASREYNEADEMRKPENVMSLLQVDPIELEFGYGILPLVDANQGGDLLDRLVMIRRQCALDLGIVVPVIRLRDNIQLKPNEYVIKIKGTEVANGEIMFDNYLAMNPGTAEEDLEGIKTVEPAFGLPAVWITESQREKAEMMGYTVVDPPSIIATHLTEIIKAHAGELLGRQEVQKLLDNLKESYPALVDEVLPKTLSLGEIHKVLVNLLKENISIRDLVTIMETLADYGTMTKDPDILTEYVRQSLSRYITKRFISGKKAKFITLSQELEQIIIDSVKQTDYGTYISLDPAITQAIAKSLMKEIQKFISIGEQPMVLTSPSVRMYFKRIAEGISPGIVVLSYNEIDPSVEVQSIGMVNI